MMNRWRSRSRGSRDPEASTGKNRKNPFGSSSESDPDSWRLPEEISVNSDNISEFSPDPEGMTNEAQKSSPPSSGTYTYRPTHLLRHQDDDDGDRANRSRVDAPPSVAHDFVTRATEETNRRGGRGSRPKWAGSRATGERSSRSQFTDETGHDDEYLKRRIIIWVVLGVSLLIAVVIATVFIKGSAGNTETVEPMVDEDLSPREKTILELLETISPMGLDDFGTPQRQARDWLVHDDELQLTPSKDKSNATIVERYALAVFYFATNGPEWKDNNWLEGDVCRGREWTGISCDDDFLVRAIAFDEYGLDGYIPEEIGHLYQLENLILKNHAQLRGEMPHTIGNLKRLGQIGLYNNALTGGIPRELYDATNLNYINFENNQLIGGLTIRIERLRNLEKLILFNNKFSGGLPVHQLVNSGIRLLALSNNHFDGTISDSIGDLHLLEFVHLENNKFNGPLPTTVGRLKRLKSLNLNGNEITGMLPTELGMLPLLEFLSLEGNQIEGSLPTEMNNLANLRTLNLAENSLTGRIPDTKRLDRLKQLYLYENKLSGTLPATLTGMDSLEVLFLSSNELSGTMDMAVNNFNGPLTGLYLSDNNLEGTLPSALCKLDSLEALFVDTNNLEGEIPSCLGQVTTLRQVYVFQNELTGQVPDELSQLRELNGLGLETNHFVGSVPMDVCLIRPLRDVWSDCLGQQPEITCTCCTTCCPPEGCQ